MVKLGPGSDTRRPDGLRLLTVGHGTLSSEELVRILASAGAQAVVDVRSAPGSRRHPQFGRAELARWLPRHGVIYRWEPDLGGFRRPTQNSANVALRHPSFRAYADYMASPVFADALAGLLDEARRLVTCAMCAETLWWRCHRRLIADAAVLLHHAEVWHLDHRGQLRPHRLTDGLHLVGDTLVYDIVAGPKEAVDPAP